MENKDTQPLLELAIASWRFGRAYSRATEKLDANEQGKYQSQLRYFLRQIEASLAQIGLNLVVLDGSPFGPGLAVTAINLADFQADDQLVVDETYEPVVMGPDGVIRTGTVTVRKVSA